MSYLLFKPLAESLILRAVFFISRHLILFSGCLFISQNILFFSDSFESVQLYIQGFFFPYCHSIISASSGFNPALYCVLLILPMEFTSSNFYYNLILKLEFWGYLSRKTLYLLLYKFQRYQHPDTNCHVDFSPWALWYKFNPKYIMSK